MGKILSVLKGEEAGEKTTQELEVLQKLVEAKLNQFQSDINEHFLNPDSAAKTQVPGIRALRWERKAYTQVEDRPADSVEKAVDDFFDAGSKENPHAVKNGFKGVVKTALDVFLGNTTAGELTEEKFFVYMLHNTIVRIDVRLWRWNFNGQGLSDKYKSALGYIICVSAVDPTNLYPAEFIYLISEYNGDHDEDVKKYIESMTDMYQQARETHDMGVKQGSSQHGRQRLK